MHRSKHALQITNRFRQLVGNAGHTLPEEHYDELTLLIEAGIDTALVERLERMAESLEKLAREVRSDAEHFA